MKLHTCCVHLTAGFSVDRVPENLDVIVIGSGIGGLTVAATLAKAGRKVLLLEQHDQAGGCCHTFVEKGFEFDVGKRPLHLHLRLGHLADAFIQSDLQ